MKTAHLRPMILLAFLLLSSSRALACPEGQYQGLFGWCYPEIGGAVGDSFEHLKREIPAQLGGNPLEGWVIASRNTSINGAQPIPPQIRQALTGYIDDDVMNIARFRIGDSGVLNLAGLTIQYGDGVPHEFEVSVSVGVAEVAVAADIGAAFEAADKAAYASKEAGRARVSKASDAAK